MSEDNPFPSDSALFRLFCVDGEYPAEIVALLSCGLFRVLKKEARRGADIGTLVNPEQVAHIRDWLRVSIDEKRPWLSNVDARGRPKKMLKYPTVAAILAEVDRDMIRFSRNVGKITLRAGDEELWMELDEGFALVRLLSPASLDQESSVMQHCIGQGGYDRYLETGERVFLSLRDPSNRAHATLEVGKDGTIHQLQGKQNAPPLRRYIDFLRKAFLDPRLKPASVLGKLGLVLSVDGDFLDKYNLPPGASVIGGLEYGHGGRIDRPDDAVFELPEHLSTSGDLVVRANQLLLLPPGLSVGGNLSVNSSLLTSIPSDMNVKGAVEFIDMAISEFPDDMTFQGDLFLRRVKLGRFPSRLHVLGNLEISDCEIAVVPHDLCVDGSISFTRCKIGSFAPGFRSRNCLALELCEIGSLPEGFEVGGALDLTYATVSDIPESAAVVGTLNITLATFNHLPSGWAVGGGIEAGGATLASMPGRSRVNGNLVLADSKVTSIDEVIKVAGDLSISSTGISALAEGLSVDGELDAKHSSLSALPPGFSVGGRLLLASSKVLRLPDHLSLSASCDLADTAIRELPARFSCQGYLDIVHSQIRIVPEGCRIGQLMCAELPESVGDDVVVERGVIIMGSGEILTLDQVRAKIAEHRSVLAA